MLLDNDTIIFDETLSHLDAGTIRSVMAGLKQLNKTCIIITHDPGMIGACDSVLNLSVSV